MRLMSLCVAFACLFSITLVNKEKKKKSRPKPGSANALEERQSAKKIPALPDDINQHL